MFSNNINFMNSNNISSMNSIITLYHEADKNPSQKDSPHLD